MCWACEEEQMFAAYRHYVEQRKAAQAKSTASPTADAAGEAAPVDDDWAKGTWFAARVNDKND